MSIISSTGIQDSGAISQQYAVNAENAVSQALQTPQQRDSETLAAPPALEHTQSEHEGEIYSHNRHTARAAYVSGSSGETQSSANSESADDAEKTDAAQDGEHTEKAQNGKELTPDEQQQLKELKERDQDVRDHEQAHQAAGGQYASSPSYDYQKGPDGKDYAIGGHVNIDTSEESTPEKTVAKMQQVIRAAHAPKDPSSQDLKVASEAQQTIAKAQQEIAKEALDGGAGKDDDGAKQDDKSVKPADGKGAQADKAGTEKTSAKDKEDSANVNAVSADDSKSLTKESASGSPSLSGII